MTNVGASGCTMIENKAFNRTQAAANGDWLQRQGFHGTAQEPSTAGKSDL